MVRDKAGVTRFDIISRHIVRKLLGFLGKITIREREYAFILQSLHNLTACSSAGILRILDIGSSSSLLPWRLARKGYDVTAVDIRPYPFRQRNLHFIQADITSCDFGRNLVAFDVAICISTIEHIGIGHYGDSMAQEGDKLALDSIHRVLKPMGALIITMPFSGQYNQDDFQRIYDPDSIFRVFSLGWRLKEERYYIPKSRKHWVLASREEAILHHKAWPESNNACFWFEKV
jgi:2-polyprenyl-3-methyl-5-hydroxy-6-metoxy-1,4-benzoquinol methylase